ncbi:hypothetical protein BKA93DRAFT_748331 [Sparassis latifolia]
MAFHFHPLQHLAGLVGWDQSQTQSGCSLWEKRLTELPEPVPKAVDYFHSAMLMREQGTHLESLKQLQSLMALLSEWEFGLSHMKQMENYLADLRIMVQPLDKNLKDGTRFKACQNCWSWKLHRRIEFDQRFLLLVEAFSGALEDYVRRYSARTSETNEYSEISKITMNL